jgi:hypothetical protein
MTSSIASRPLVAATAAARGAAGRLHKKQSVLVRRNNATSRRRMVLTKSSVDTSVDDPLAEQFKTMYPGGSGKRIKWGVFQQDISAAELEALQSNPEKAQELRNEATESLTNINGDERSRRYKAGAGAAVFCAVLAAFQLSTGAPPSQRALIALPLFFALGFTGRVGTPGGVSWLLVHRHTIPAVVN